MLDHKRVVIVGGGLGGWRTAEELRTAGFAGQLTILCDENYPPYDRPPLSKRLLKPDFDAVPDLLAPAGSHESLRIRPAMRYRSHRAATGRSHDRLGHPSRL